ncbi:MAG: copper transporter [Firmicutes bacterium]|nr:copper transporter [Bacillota bacterium]
MIIDIRYHVASLVAVFLALGMGMLIGASLLDEGRLVESQEKLIAGLERRFDGLQAERHMLEDEITALNNTLNQQELMLQALESPLIDGALKDQTVTLVYGNEAWLEKEGPMLGELLARAGAEVVYSTVLTELLPNKITFSHPESANNGDGNHWLSAADWLPFGSSDLSEQPRLLGEPKPTRPSPLGLVDVILLVKSTDDAMIPWETRLLKEAVAAGVAVGVVGDGELESFAKEMAETHILIVDHIHSATGRIGLVRGLFSRSAGYYGMGKGALGLLPDLALHYDVNDVKKHLSSQVGGISEGGSDN